MRKSLLILTALVLIAAGREAAAQWAVGLGAGINSTTISRYDAGRMDEAYSPLRGATIALRGRYAFTPWLAVRAELGYMQRSHRMDRNLDYIDPVYTEHLNHYLMLPVLADCSFGGERLRGHLLAGAYAGYWLSERRRGTSYWMTDYYVFFEDFDERREFTDSDVRPCAGLAFGAALSYPVGKHLEAGADVLYYYDATSHHRGYKHLADPRYLNTLAFSLHLNYKLP